MWPRHGALTPDQRTAAGQAITDEYLSGRDSQWHNAASRRGWRRLYEADMGRIGVEPIAESEAEAAIHQQDTDRAAR